MCLDPAYREMVDRNLANNSSEVFCNFSRAHAEYIISQFIARANNSIEILTGNFDDDLYNNISVETLLGDAAARIAKNGGKIRIITLAGKRSVALDEMVERINGNLALPEGDSQKIVQYCAGTCAEPEKVNHYIIVDKMRYRLEEPHKQEPECVHAEICCNGPQRSAQLLAGFNKAWRILA